jgi:DNA-binding transcriptional ArsR family regulator
VLTHINIAIILSAMSTKKLIRAIDPAGLAKAADVIKVVGHPDRLRILEFLEDGEKAVGDIQEILGLGQAIVSQHLAKMRGWDIVESRRDGTHVYYRIIEPKVSHILDCFRHCDLAE